MTARILFLICVFTLLLSGCTQENVTFDQGTIITKRNEFISVEIADTQKERTQGLQNRTTLDPNKGMIFLFEKQGVYTFWMKDVHFPLDMLWLQDGKIVYIVREVEPFTDGEVTIVEPEVAADEVLELRGGSVDLYDIDVGDILRLKKP